VCVCVCGVYVCVWCVCLRVCVCVCVPLYRQATTLPDKTEHNIKLHYMVLGEVSVVFYDMIHYDGM
jgi:hypothetical protein